MEPKPDQRQLDGVLYEVDVTIWGEWLTEPRTQDATLKTDRADTGDFQLYIRNGDGKIVKVKRVFVELDQTGGK